MDSHHHPCDSKVDQSSNLYPKGFQSVLPNCVYRNSLPFFLELHLQWGKDTWVQNVLENRDCREKLRDME